MALLVFSNCTKPPFFELPLDNSHSLFHAERLRISVHSVPCPLIGKQGMWGSVLSCRRDIFCISNLVASSRSLAKVGMSSSFRIYFRRSSSCILATATSAIRSSSLSAKLQSLAVARLKRAKIRFNSFSFFLLPTDQIATRNNRPNSVLEKFGADFEGFDVGAWQKHFDNWNSERDF